MFLNSASSLSNLSGTTFTQVDTLTQNCGEEPPNLQESQKDEKADSGVCDGEVDASQVRPGKKNSNYIRFYNIYIVQLHQPELIQHKENIIDFCSKFFCVPLGDVTDEGLEGCMDQ